MPQTPHLSIVYKEWGGSPKNLKNGEIPRPQIFNGKGPYRSHSGSQHRASHTCPINMGSVHFHGFTYLRRSLYHLQISYLPSKNVEILH